MANNLIDINDVRNIRDIRDMEDQITVNGVAYDADELTHRVLTVKGVQPTNYEEWTFIDILADLRNKKIGAGGVAQTTYRYSDLTDLDKFHEHEYPYKLSVLMIDAADKKGNVVQEVVYADFAGAVELMLVARNPPIVNESSKTLPKPQSKA